MLHIKNIEVEGIVHGSTADDLTQCGWGFSVEFNYPVKYSEVPTIMQELSEFMRKHQLWKCVIERSKRWDSKKQCKTEEDLYQVFTNKNTQSAPPMPTLKEAMEAAATKFE